MSQSVQRIKEYIDYKGFTIAEFERKIGMSNASFGRSLKNNGSIGSDKIENILSLFPEINPAWLLTGNGSMILEDSIRNTELREPEHVYGLRTDTKKDLQSIPLYNIEASAGIVKLFQHQNDTEAIDHITVPNLPKCDGAIYVTGDSMYPLLKSGDIIMYKEIQSVKDTIFIWGEMYLVSLDLDDEEYVAVKWIQKSELGTDFVKLVSQNQHHQPIDVPKHKLRACAMVKASIRINSMN